MNKKRITIGILVLLLFVSYVFIVIDSKKASLSIFEKIKNEDTKDISLTIYYMSPYALPFIPISSVEDFIQRTSDGKIVINGTEMGKSIHLFKQINNDVLVPLTPFRKRSSFLGLRIYYVIKSKKNGKLFDVAMWGDGNNMFVNGIEVEENSILYDAIIPFLPKDEAECLEDFKTHDNMISY